MATCETSGKGATDQVKRFHVILVAPVSLVPPFARILSVEGWNCEKRQAVAFATMEKAEPIRFRVVDCDPFHPRRTQPIHRNREAIDFLNQVVRLGGCF